MKKMLFLACFITLSIIVFAFNVPTAQPRVVVVSKTAGLRHASIAKGKGNRFSVDNGKPGAFYYSCFAPFAGFPWRFFALKNFNAKERKGGSAKGAKKYATCINKRMSH